MAATGRNVPVPSLRSRLVAAAIAVVVFLIATAGLVARFYTDLAWFTDLGQTQVFLARIWSEVAVAAAFGVATFLIIYVNVAVARRMRPLVATPVFPQGIAMTPQQQIEELFSRLRSGLDPLAPWVLLGVSAFLAFNIGIAMGNDWQVFRLALTNGRFGIVDPQFRLDVGFFVFTLPALRAIADWLLGVLALALIGSVLVHLYEGGIRPTQRFQGVDPHVKGHISLVLGLIVVAKAFDYWLSMHELDFSPRGQVLGASFTDVHAQIPAYWILIVIALAVGVLLALNLRFKGWRLPLVGLGIWIAASLIVGAIYPAVIQQLQVAPNELSFERPYIRRNILATRQAFDLESVMATGFAASADLTAKDLREATTTVSNIRLWDPNIVIDSYKQLQEIRFYYDFNDVDIDRYTIDGAREQVLISVREMNDEQLSDQAKTWINRHLVYTHGYGAVVSPVNRVTSDGLPQFLIKDLPPQSSTDLTIKTPGIYFGEETSDYAIVGGSQKEFDYPVGGENATTAYEGGNGVPVGSLADRLAFAIRTGDIEILFSSAIDSDSRILFRRAIRERVEALAPWLAIDRDPYPVIVDGRVLWVLDGYTTSDHYPYSERYPGSDVNYMRNSVKVTVDAYDGTTTLYAFDGKDPVLAAYRRIFPGLLKDAAEIPAGIRAHLRYPEDLFRIQAEVYKTYHMSDPSVFYNKEDQWAIPGERDNDPMDPFYVLMQLPNEQREEFLLMQPFTPRNKDNMIGWMAAKSDGDSYGQRVVYNFPKQKLVLGPQQIRARLNQEPDISKELTLLDQQGSRVIFGNLLVIPIRDSIVYIEPLYIQAEKSPMPELKRVIVAYADKVTMEADLTSALNTVFGAAPPSEDGTTAPEPQEPEVADTIEEARTLYERALAAQRAGDWAAYGRHIRQLGSVLERLSGAAGAATSAP